MYKVLIVDDEQLTRNFLKLTIPKLNDQWEVVGEAEEGYEALEILATTAVDLVITDIRMPEMDGLELCQHLYEKFPKVYCAILSGYGEFEYAKKAIDYEVKNYLLKPIVNEALLKLLNSIANKLDQEIKIQEIYNNLRNASEIYKEEIISKFLKAVILNSNVEIQSLYPILYSMKVSVIDAEGIIFIFHLSEDMLIEQRTPISQLGLLKLMLYNIAKKCMNDTSNKVFFDSEENTVLLAPVSDTDTLPLMVHSIYTTLQKAFKEETGLNFFCTVGSLENDLLLMAQSYQNAQEAFLQCLFLNNPPTSYRVYDASDNRGNLSSLMQHLSSLIFYLNHQDTVNIQLMAKEISAFVTANMMPTSTLKLLFLLIHKLEDSLPHRQSFSSLYKAYLEELCNAPLPLTNFYELLIKLVDAFTDCYKQTDSIYEGPGLVKKTKRFIYEHYMEPISLSLIADHLSVSSSYLSNLFHETEGQSYIKYLTEVRMKQGVKLLKDDVDMNLETIAQKVGYISVKHFSFIFKKYYGLSPGEYRKNFK